MGKRYLFVFDTGELTYYRKSDNRDAMRALKNENAFRDDIYAKSLKIVDLKTKRVVSEAVAAEVNGRKEYHYSRENIDKLNSRFGKFLDEVYAKGVPF